MLHLFSLFTILLGIGSSLWLLVAAWRRPAQMAVMNWVWPLVALSGGPLVIWLYRRHHRWPHGKAPFSLAAAVATCHCGAGCTLGDVMAEGLSLTFPGILVWFGWKSLFGDRIFAGWVLDFVLAYLLGIAFQYFSIAPMRKLDLRDGIFAALKADTLSLAAWQVGMYGAMAVAQFGIARLKADTSEFWFAMQIAMLAGFCVAYPVNIWLLKTGLKEKM